MSYRMDACLSRIVQCALVQSPTVVRPQLEDESMPQGKMAAGLGDVESKVRCRGSRVRDDPGARSDAMDLLASFLSLTKLVRRLAGRDCCDDRSVTWCQQEWDRVAILTRPSFSALRERTVPATAPCSTYVHDHVLFASPTASVYQDFDCQHIAVFRISQLCHWLKADCVARSSTALTQSARRIIPTCRYVTMILQHVPSNLAGRYWPNVPSFPSLKLICNADHITICCACRCLSPGLLIPGPSRVWTTSSSIPCRSQEVTYAAIDKIIRPPALQDNKCIICPIPYSSCASIVYPIPSSAAFTVSPDISASNPTCSDTWKRHLKNNAARLDLKIPRALIAPRT
nr:hypothetical protein CFP56_30671 [Quercus suber]